VSLGVGLQDQFVGRFLRSGMFDSITVMPGALQGNAPFGGGRGARARSGRGAARTPAPDDPPQRPLDDESLAELRALEHVRDVYPQLRVPLEVRLDEVTEYGLGSGVPASARGEGAFQKIAHGQFLPEGEADACMLSLGMARRLSDEPADRLLGRELTLIFASAAPGAFAPGMPGGAMFQVRRVEEACRIVGIVERETGPLGVGGAGVSPVMLPLDRARRINAQVAGTQRVFMRPQGVTDSLYQTVTVKVTRPQHTQDVQERIRTLGYSAFSLNDTLAEAKRAFLILDIILGLVGSIALAVASLGIMNTMVMSILERTREIGIMKAIGGSDADVRRIFLIEASAIGVVGGVLGVVLGWVVGRGINFAANQYIVSQGGTAGNLFSLPLWLIAAAIAFSLFVSLAAGALPARRAARLDPIHALRHD